MSQTPDETMTGTRCWVALRHACGRASAPKVSSSSSSETGSASSADLVHAAKVGLAAEPGGVEPGESRLNGGVHGGAEKWPGGGRREGRRRVCCLVRVEPIDARPGGNTPSTSWTAAYLATATLPGSHTHIDHDTDTDTDTAVTVSQRVRF